MDSIKAILTRRLSLLLLATLLLQSVVVLSGTLIKLSLPRYQVALPGVMRTEQPLLLQHDPINSEAESAAAAPLVGPQRPPQAKVVIYRVQAGDTLARIWERYTGSRQGALHAAEAFKSAKVPLSSLRKGENIELQIAWNRDITGVRKQLDGGRVLLLDGSSEAGYAVTVVEPNVAEVNKTVTGTIYSSLSADASEQGVPYEIIDAFVDLLSSNIEFRKDLQPGDTFSVTYTEQQTEDGQVISLGKITSASIITKGALHAAIGYSGKGGKLHYYDKDGNPIGNYFLRYPVTFTRISSVFTTSRLHPILGVKRPHEGVDFAAPLGTPVRTVGSGRVSFAGCAGPAGKMIKIDHNSRYSTAYLHLSAIKKGLKKGSSVERGELIGYVGSTGLSTGPHLDFRLAVNGKYVNPLGADMPKILDSKDRIPKRVLMAALTELNQAHETQRMLALRRDQDKRVS